MLRELLTRLFSLFGSFERPSPSDIVPRGSILVQEYPAGVFISMLELNIPFTAPPRVWVPLIPDTNSMDGAFDYGNNNILIQGIDEENQRIMIDFLKVGDIAVYETIYGPIIHRIVKIGQDDGGRYFRFKGDNNGTRDPHKVRDTQISWLSIGTIY